ncbi:MAG: hypothetical protein D8H97_36760, partial [Neisseria sp.]
NQGLQFADGCKCHGVCLLLQVAFQYPPVRVLRGYWRNVRHGKAGEIRFECIQSMVKRRKDIVRLIL